MTVITEFQTHIFDRLKTFYAGINEELGHTQVKAFNTAVTFVFKGPDGEWKSHKITSGERKRSYFGINLPPNEKRHHNFILTYLQKVLATEDCSQIPEFEFVVNRLQVSKPGSKESKQIIDGFKRSNQKRIDANWVAGFLQDSFVHIMQKVDKFATQLFVSKIDIQVEVAPKTDLSSTSRHSFSADFHHVCEKCQGYRTTLSKVDDCAGCLKEKPSCVTETFLWHQYEDPINPACASTSTH